MRQFEIYNASYRWRDCDDMRPWVIIDLRANSVFGCFPISSQDYDGTAFQLDQSDPCFAATGLNKTCYIHDQYIVELHASCFGRRRGELLGELLASFRKFSGT